jgi:4-hydroxybenzoate polyprenyltransferase
MVGLVTVASAVVGVAGWELVLVAAAVLAGQLSVGWSNDYIDARLDKEIGRRNKPVVGQGLDPEALRVPITAALVLVVPLSFMAAGVIGGIAHLVAVASAWVYNLYLARTTWSWVPYAVSFALLPVFVAQSASSDTWPTIPVVALSMLVGVVAHLINAIPDIDIDKTARIGGLAVALGRRNSIVLAASLVTVALFVAFFVVTAWMG